MACAFDGQEHDLLPVYSRGRGEDEALVVRWCRKCGAVVVDYDIDGRVFPGYYAKMMFPALAVKAAGEKA